MALLFALGSLCFLIGPFPGYAQLVGATADAATFFAGSVLFTAAGALQTWLAAPGRHAPGAGRGAWWAATVQSAGTLFFNVTTFHALNTALSEYISKRTGLRIDFQIQSMTQANGPLHGKKPRHPLGIFLRDEAPEWSRIPWTPKPKLQQAEA